MYTVLELKILWCQKQTHRRENLDKAISFGQKSASMYLLQLSRHVSTKWSTTAPPYIPDAVVPAPTQDLSRLKVHNLP
jgi:hypothetical protein